MLQISFFRGQDLLAALCYSDWESADECDLLRVRWVKFPNAHDQGDTPCSLFLELQHKPNVSWVSTLWRLHKSLHVCSWPGCLNIFPRMNCISLMLTTDHRFTADLMDYHLLKDLVWPLIRIQGSVHCLIIHWCSSPSWRQKIKDLHFSTD